MGCFRGNSKRNQSEKNSTKIQQKSFFRRIEGGFTPHLPAKNGQ
jgi:hypothetical protein